MKHLLLSLCCPAVAALLLCAAAPAPKQDCAKDSDACSATPAKRSPFLEASADPGKPAADPKPVKNNKRQPAAPGQPAAAQISTVAASTAAAAPAASEPPASPEPPAVSSNPLWILFAGAGLAGLYWYLKSGSGKRRRK